MYLIKLDVYLYDEIASFLVEITGELVFLVVINLQEDSRIRKRSKYLVGIGGVLYIEEFTKII